jgi:hypothetical protein
MIGTTPLIPSVARVAGVFGPLPDADTVPTTEKTNASTKTTIEKRFNILCLLANGIILMLFMLFILFIVALPLAFGELPKYYFGQEISLLWCVIPREKRCAPRSASLFLLMASLPAKLK